MPTHKKRKPKKGLNENAEIKSKWEAAIENRTPIYCPERKATVYEKK